MTQRSIYVGWDQRERDAYSIATMSLSRHLSEHVPIRPVHFPSLQERGLYTRPTTRSPEGRLIDMISRTDTYDGSMSTEHAIARFFVPHLSKGGFSLFCDGDVMFRSDVIPLFELAEQRPEIALWCVQHDFRPDASIKMDRQVQTKYNRKNWSSFMLFNCDHVSHEKLTIQLLNSVPGRDLHAFRWLEDDVIGALPPSWNFLVGHNDRTVVEGEHGHVNMVHYTSGLPDQLGCVIGDFVDEWWNYWRTLGRDHDKIAVS